MIAQAVQDAAGEGIAEEDLVIERSGDFRFLGQVYEVAVPLADRSLTRGRAAQLAASSRRSTSATTARALRGRARRWSC
jgi:hypothetical protein